MESNGSSISVNTYIPSYVKGYLKWYERDGLLTYIDRLKYQRFEENRDCYFANTKIVNFDIIHVHCRGQTQEKSDKYYQTVREETFEKMPENDKKRQLLPALEPKGTICTYKETL